MFEKAFRAFPRVVRSSLVFFFQEHSPSKSNYYYWIYDLHKDSFQMNNVSRWWLRSLTEFVLVLSKYQRVSKKTPLILDLIDVRLETLSVLVAVADIMHVLLKTLSSFMLLIRLDVKSIALRACISPCSIIGPQVILSSRSCNIMRPPRMTWQLFS